MTSSTGIGLEQAVIVGVEFVLGADGVGDVQARRELEVVMSATWTS